jgi:hypothetical protein
VRWGVTSEERSVRTGDDDRAEGDDRCHQGDAQICAQSRPVSSRVTLGVTAAWIMDASRDRRIGDRPWAQTEATT